jgi:dephospho-CoA kinase
LDSGKEEMKLKKEFVKLTPSQRLYSLGTPVVGLTGGIATGKSTVSKILMSRGLTVIDADQLVKSIYQKPEAIEFVRKNYPQVLIENKIDFRELRKKVFSSPEVKMEIENFIYLRLPGAFSEAISRVHGSQVIIYDVPLLFEKQLQSKFDLNVLVYAPQKIQLARLITRDGQTEEMAQAIIDQQIDIELKKTMADYIIDNSLSESELRLSVNGFMDKYFEA